MMQFRYESDGPFTRPPDTQQSTRTDNDAPIVLAMFIAVDAADFLLLTRYSTNALINGRNQLALDESVNLIVKCLAGVTDGQWTDADWAMGRPFADRVVRQSAELRIGGVANSSH